MWIRGNGVFLESVSYLDACGGKVSHARRLRRGMLNGDRKRKTTKREPAIRSSARSQWLDDDRHAVCSWAFHLPARLAIVSLHVGRLLSTDWNRRGGMKRGEAVCRAARGMMRRRLISISLAPAPSRADVAYAPCEPRLIKWFQKRRSCRAICRNSDNQASVPSAIHKVRLSRNRPQKRGSM